VASVDGHDERRLATDALSSAPVEVPRGEKDNQRGASARVSDAQDQEQKLDTNLATSVLGQLSLDADPENDILLRSRVPAEVHPSLRPSAPEVVLWQYRDPTGQVQGEKET
jgi:hypothetical protein